MKKVKSNKLIKRRVLDNLKIKLNKMFSNKVKNNK